MIHELKTDPEVFQAVFDGIKSFEVRYDDRGFNVGDELRLKETKYSVSERGEGAPLVYTGRIVSAFVTYILRGPNYGLPEGMCIMSLVLKVQS